MSADQVGVQTSRRLDALDARVALRGRLSSAHVAVRQIDGDGHVVPVLVLELHDVGAGHHAVIAHVSYAHDARPDAERAARRLKRDQLVEVETSLADVRLFLPGASFSLVTEEGDNLAPDHPHDH